ncbi:cullin [Tieghemostelium lacteum]|uniref:Cullin n=1 Tax=Tieghemostelium lacteum TaxID=361077 RepID=A0A151ZFE2_TIELA|nr:cullin [Tieghemostelium lacteum]|eukprot:KYQ92686.1 cullin [Tieghemostelium lacteum]
MNSNVKKLGITSTGGIGAPNKKTLVIKNFKQLPKTSDTFEEDSWNKLLSAIQSIQNKQPTIYTQEELYRTVENLCSEKLYSNLYQKLEFQIDKQTERSLLKLVNQTGDIITFLHLINMCWQDHTSQLIMIRSIFLCLDRTYVIQNNQHLRSIWDLGLYYFKHYLLKFPDLVRKVNIGLLENIQKERNGDRIDSDLMHSLVKMLTALQIYNTFENEFLIETDKYYTIEGGQYMNDNEVPEYLKHTQDRVNEEYDRSIRYLDPSTKRPLIAVVEKQLIERNVSNILSKGFNNLMVENRIEDLSRLYSLFQRVNAIKELKVAFGGYIKQVGQSMINDAQKEATLIQDLIELKDKLDNILELSFSKNQILVYSLKESFEYFINLKSNKPAELIAKYADSKLRSSNKRMSEDDLEVVLNKLLILFRYIQGKDVFEAFYKQDLAKRLLMDKSASIDAEKSMISKLKTECGTSFTEKLEEMFKDIDLSNDLMNSFRDSNQFSSIGIDLNVYVLTGSNWPVQPPSTVELPVEFKEYLDVFSQFYHKKYSGRQLKWQHGVSHCIIKANFPLGKKDLFVSLFQTLLLYQYNDKSEFTIRELQESTKIEIDAIKRNLMGLLNSKTDILLRRGKQKTQPLELDDVIEFNSKFQHKLMRIKVNSIQSQETAEENKKTNDAVTQDRQYQIDAAIVRIMKDRKALNHNTLMTELFTQLKFAPKPVDLKRRVESLIEREYLGRDPENPMVYIYLT